MKKNKSVFTTKDVNGNDIELAVVRPSQKVQVDAQKVYNRAYRDAIDSGVFLKKKTLEIMTEQGLWSEDKDKQIVELQLKLFQDGKTLEEKKYSSLEEGNEIAGRMAENRLALQRLFVDRGLMDEQTVEYQAETQRLNYLISACTVYNNTGKPFFINFEDFYERSEEASTIDASTNFLLFINEIDPDFEKNYPENKFLAENEVKDESTTVKNDTKEDSEVKTED